MLIKYEQTGNFCSKCLITSIIQRVATTYGSYQLPVSLQHCGTSPITISHSSQCRYPKPFPLRKTQNKVECTKPCLSSHKVRNQSTKIQQTAKIFIIDNSPKIYPAKTLCYMYGIILFGHNVITLFTACKYIPGLLKTTILYKQVCSYKLITTSL